MHLKVLRTRRLADIADGTNKKDADVSGRYREARSSDREKYFRREEERGGREGGRGEEEGGGGEKR